MPAGARRATYRRLGLRGQCGREPWRKGASLCQMHREDATDRQNTSRRRRKRTKTMRKKARTFQARLRQKRRAAGLCLECGIKVEKYVACLLCRLADRARRRKVA